MAWTARLALASLACALMGSPAMAADATLELSQRQLQLGEKLTLQAAHSVAEKLFRLDAEGNEPITLVIATRSGYIPAAMVVVDAIRSLKSPVNALVPAEAFGAGAVVAVFCKQRYVFAHGAFLFRAFEYDDEKVMKGKDAPLPADAAKQYVDRAYEAVAKQLGMRAADLRSRAEKGWYLPAAEARKAGVASAVVSQVTWIDLTTEITEVKKTSIVKEKRPIARIE